MPNKLFFSGRIPQEIWDAVNEAAIESNKTRTQIMIEALCAYLEMPIDSIGKTSIEQKFEEIEQRLAFLEAQQKLDTSKPYRPSLSEFFSEERVTKHYGNGNKKA